MWEWDTNQDAKDVRSFLGFVNYYRRHVHQFAKVAYPLTELTKKGVEWQWGPYQKEALCQLKEKLCEPPILWYLDLKLPYTFHMLSYIHESIFLRRIMLAGCEYL